MTAFSKGLFRATLIAGFALATSFAQAQSGDWDKTIADAKAEKRLVLYTALVGDATLKAIVQGFTAKYGIAVEVLEGRATEIRERQRTEMAAGRYLGDVTFTSEGQARLIAKADGTYVPHEATPNLKSLKPDFAKFTNNGLFAPVMSIPYGILINTQQVKPADEPRSWADIANPKWKGKILSDDVRAVGGGYLMFFAQLNAPSLGETFHEALAQNDLSFTRDMRQAGQRVARGEYAMYVPFILSDVLGLKGLPVKAIIPQEGVPFVLYGNVLNKNAPRPNAARLYIDYWLSEDAQVLWGKAGMGLTRDGLADKIPEDMRAFSNAKLLGTTDPDRQDEGLALAKKIYK